MRGLRLLSLGAAVAIGLAAPLAMAQPAGPSPGGPLPSDPPPDGALPPAPDGAMPKPPAGQAPQAGKMMGPPPAMKRSPDTPMYAQGGGRVLFSAAQEIDTLRNLNPPLGPDAPQPPADLRNLEGAWAKDQPAIARIEYDVYGGDIPFSAAGRATRDRRVKSTYVDARPYSNASGECLPPGQPWLFGMYYPFHIYQTGKQVVILFEYDHAQWTIRLDGAHRDGAAPRGYMGDSIGRWDGDTLAVETTAFKRDLWMDFDGTPVSKDARLTFRIRRINTGTPRLEILTTVDDPKNYTAPWSFVRTFGWRTDRNVLAEYNCESQVAEGGAAAFGLVVEPDAP